MQGGSLYANRELALSLSVSSTEPAESELKVQLTNQQHLSVKIEPITGRFMFSPGSPSINESVARLNRSLNPANDGHTYIEKLRAALVIENITRLGLTTGWVRTRGPGLKNDVLQDYLPKEFLELMWLQRSDWLPDWHLAFSLTRGGEHWQLLQV